MHRYGLTRALLRDGLALGACATSNATMIEEKPSLREIANTARAGLARECPDFAARVAQFADALAAAPGAIVSFYWPMGDEADPRLLANTLAARGHTLARPVVAVKKSPLYFRAWREGDPLIVHPFGMHEPPE